jgi:C4-dicarboxylate-specific signal transduction histidine kinase
MQPAMESAAKRPLNSLLRGAFGRRLIWILGLAAALMVVITSVVAALGLRETERQAWRHQMSNLSLTLAEHASQTLFSAHTVLGSLNDVVKAARLETEPQWREFASAPTRHQLLVDKVSSNPVIDVATFVSSQGEVLNFTRSFPPPPINLAERDYFKAHVANPRIEVFTSVPVRNKGNGKWVFYITRRVNNSQGEMLGLILVGVSVEVFSRFYERVASNLGDGASISLYRRDMTLMTRWPHRDELVGQRNMAGATHEVLDLRGQSHDVVETRLPRFTEGQAPTPRMAAPRALERYPFVVTPVVTADFYLRNWRDMRNWILTFAALSLALLAAGMAMLLRAQRQIEAELAQRVRAQTLLLSLHDQLEERVKERTAELSREVQERKQAQSELAQLNARIAAVSHRAGMAEVANSVLHNVGNVLNSVNVSVNLLSERLRHTPMADLPAASALIAAHRHDLAEFLTHNPQGQQFPAFISLLAQHWQQEHALLIGEAEQLRASVGQIKEIVGRQQALSGQTGLREWIAIDQMVGEVLAIHELPLRLAEIAVTQEHKTSDPWMGDRIKISQILLNLVVNAEEALRGSPNRPRTLHVESKVDERGALILAVSDNGPGIEPVAMERLFGYGFTTKADGHGFGLHASALAAQEMGGTLQARSEGVSRGAQFVLSLPGVSA